MTEEQRREMASRLAQRMDAQGLTNERLAHQAGVSSKTISRILNAHHDPRIATIEKVADAAGFSREEFRGLTETPDVMDRLSPTDGDYERRLDAMEQRLARIQTIVELLAGEKVVEAANRELERATQPDASKRPPRAA